MRAGIGEDARCRDIRTAFDPKGDGPGFGTQLDRTRARHKGKVSIEDESFLNEKEWGNAIAKPLATSIDASRDGEVESVPGREVVLRRERTAEPLMVGRCSATSIQLSSQGELSPVPDDREIGHVPSALSFWVNGVGEGGVMSNVGVVTREGVQGVVVGVLADGARPVFHPAETRAPPIRVDEGHLACPGAVVGKRLGCETLGEVGASGPEGRWIQGLDADVVREESEAQSDGTSTNRRPECARDFLQPRQGTSPRRQIACLRRCCDFEIGADARDQATRPNAE